MNNSNIFLVTEVKIYLVNNKYYADNSFSKILYRYYFKFKNISILSRILKQDTAPKGFTDISSYCQRFINSNSISKFMIKHLNNEVIKEIKNSDLIILRMPSLFSFKIIKVIKKYKKKYLTEVMGCIWDSAFNHGLIGKIIAPYCFYMTKKIIYNANYCTYVTQEFLQKRYPCKNKSIAVSNVNIEDVFNDRNYSKIDVHNITMMTSAAVNVKYKGQQFVIKAISILKKRGININYYLAGKGDNMYLSKIANKYKVQENVHFLGMLSHQEVLNKLKNIDIYIQPSLQEGLPRALIEAMSCGCVCFGSKIAGIPELLNNNQLFKKKSDKSITDCIKKNISNSEEFSKISKENVLKASQYTLDKLNKTRYLYYDQIIRDINDLKG